MKIVLRLYLCVAYYFSVSVFIVVSFAINIFSFVLSWLPGSGALKRPLRAVLQFLFRRWAWFMGFIRVLDLTTPEKTEKKDSGGAIWIMNHPSFLDGSYLLKFVTNGTCIYKHKIGSNPLYGSTAKLAQHIPNVGGPDLVRQACEALERGEDLVVFPEGTRSTHVDVDRFKPGFALIAKRSGAPIELLWMDSPDDFMTRENPFWKVPRLTAKVDISPLTTLVPTDFPSPKAIFAEVVRIYGEKGRGIPLRAPFPDGSRLLVEGDQGTAQFAIPEDYPYFDGHFPGNPLVPAVTQVGWATTIVGTMVGETLREYRLSRFKFVCPVRPLDKIRIRVKSSGAKYSCRVYSNDELCSSGTLTLSGNV